MSVVEDNLPDHLLLSAYADGELGGARQAEASRRTIGDPSAAAAVEGQLQMRQALARVLSTGGGPDDALIKKIELLAWQMPAQQDAKPALGRWFLRPMSAAAAAIVLLGAGLLLGHFAWVGPPTLVVGPIQSRGPVVDASYVDFATKTHIECSHSPVNHHVGVWPAAVKELESPVRDYLGGNTDQPDLSSIGYKYLGCGPCGRPDEKTVHFLYKGVAAGDTISLFVEPYHGQVSTPTGECHLCSAPLASHPVLVWRKDNLVFFLVANTPEAEDKARQALNVPAPV